MRDADISVLSVFPPTLLFFYGHVKQFKSFSRCTSLLRLRFRRKIPTRTMLIFVGEPNADLNSCCSSGDMVWFCDLDSSSSPPCFCYCRCRLWGGARSHSLLRLDPTGENSPLRVGGWCCRFSSSCVSLSRHNILVCFCPLMSSLVQHKAFPQESCADTKQNRNKQKHGFLLFLLWYYWGSWHLPVTNGNTGCSHGAHCSRQVLSDWYQSASCYEQFLPPSSCGAGNTLFGCQVSVFLCFVFVLVSPVHICTVGCIP